MSDTLRRLALWGLAAAVACAAPGNAAVAGVVLIFELNPVADAFVSAANPDQNFGGAGALSIAGGDLPKGEFQSVLKFDPAAVKTSFDSLFGAGNWAVEGVSLQLTAAAPRNAIFNAQSLGQFSASWLQNNDWLEGTGKPNSPGATGITFNALSALVGAGDENLGTFNFDGSTSGTFTYPLTLAPGFVAGVSAGNPVSLRLLAADPNVAYVFNSREYTTAAFAPRLAIAAWDPATVPEPGTIALLMAGACTLLGLKYRRDRSRVRR